MLGILDIPRKSDQSIPRPIQNIKSTYKLFDHQDVTCCFETLGGQHGVDGHPVIE